MVVLKEHKLIWSSVPRTGTLSMINLLKQYGGVFIPKCHSHNVTEEYKGFSRFMLVRNPYTRLFSWWRWWKKPGPNQTFSEFLIWLIENKHKGKYFYSYDSQAAFGRAFQCETFLYLENLPADFRKIHVLRDADKHWQTQQPTEINLTFEEKGLIHKHSGEDFRRFGYDS